jgi:mannosyltransferase OCH1-like enzyme
MMNAALFWAVTVLIGASFIAYNLVSGADERESLEVQSLHSLGDECPLEVSRKKDFIQNTCIPCIIHQTSRVALDVSPKYVQESAHSWQTVNRNCTYSFYTDKDLEVFVQNFFPELADMWAQLLPIQKADLFRYLVVYKYGGIYADSDTIALIPADHWLGRKDNSSKCIDTSKVGALIGVEGLDATWRYYAQWTFAACAQHPGFKDLIDRIHKAWKRHGPFSKPETWGFTGPGPFTDSLSLFLDNVTLLPRSIWGERYQNLDLPVPPLVMHRSMGTWKPTVNIFEQFKLWLWPN